MPQEIYPQWSIGRFLQTLCRFQVIPFLTELQLMFFGSDLPSPPTIQANIVFDFRQPTEAMRQLWGALDDVVMGGVSASSVQIASAGLLFTGVVSTANSGGFASVRTRNFQPALDLSAYTGLELQVKGDGQRYKFFLRDSAAWDGVAYAQSFDTVANEWTQVRIPFSELQPVMRARTVGESCLNPAQIYSLQVMLSKFEYDQALNPHFTPGEFQLLIQTIGVY